MSSWSPLSAFLKRAVPISGCREVDTSLEEVLHHLRSATSCYLGENTTGVFIGIDHGSMLEKKLHHFQTLSPGRIFVTALITERISL